MPEAQVLLIPYYSSLEYGQTLDTVAVARDLLKASDLCCSGPEVVIRLINVDSFGEFPGISLKPIRSEMS